MPRHERTSASIASVAGQLLNGTATKDAVLWLEEVADDPATMPEARANAITLLGILAGLRRMAASALTQR